MSRLVAPVALVAAGLIQGGRPEVRDELRGHVRRAVHEEMLMGGEEADADRKSSDNREIEIDEPMVITGRAKQPFRLKLPRSVTNFNFRLAHPMTAAFAGARRCFKTDAEPPCTARTTQTDTTAATPFRYGPPTGGMAGHFLIRTVTEPSLAGYDSSSEQRVNAYEPEGDKDAGVDTEDEGLPPEFVEQFAQDLERILEADPADRLSDERASEILLTLAQLNSPLGGQLLSRGVFSCDELMTAGMNFANDYDQDTQSWRTMLVGAGFDKNQYGAWEWFRLPNALACDPSAE